MDKNTKINFAKAIKEFNAIFGDIIKSRETVSTADAQRLLEENKRLKRENQELRFRLAILNKQSQENYENYTTLLKKVNDVKSIVNRGV